MHSSCRQSSENNKLASAAKTHVTHCCDDIVVLFDRLFADSHQTRLVKGGGEPEYLPATKLIDHHRIVFTQDYVSSALHEVAHWCVAGEPRRLLPDYGYWYAPDGRSAQQQQQFEAVEVKPQALEWLFSVACGKSFSVSADNIESQLGASHTFTSAIVEQARDYCLNGVDQRVADFLNALSDYYGQPSALNVKCYSLAVLQ